ncbi:hypothetical protein CCY99_07440 [Helicobacter sp. 16-1353]|uniref:hypothetical protein n=1 Tax=Helicobacter sp. 16-1353 TaxID=2004996 RepID=UPI000DCDB219|nr:hypothetical protein [Helicobacter sp. 16-1353]RAX52471.1 hypothetical protein CCY99_07440 [Helicobacter sp. 16-1353]
MVVFELVGGLGNQLYIYSFAKMIEKRYGYKVALDVSWYDRHGIDCDGREARDLELLRFENDLELVNFNHLKMIRFLPFGDKIRYVFNKIMGKLRLSRLCLTPKNYLDFSQIAYSPKMLEIPDNSYVKGYFGSYKLYSKTGFVGDMEIPQFRLKTPMNDENLAMLAKINNCKNSVALHIRRGDYANIHQYAKLGATYYKRAIELMREKIAEQMALSGANSSLNLATNLQNVPLNRANINGGGSRI